MLGEPVTPQSQVQADSASAASLNAEEPQTPTCLDVQPEDTIFTSDLGTPTGPSDSCSRASAASGLNSSSRSAGPPLQRQKSVYIFTSSISILQPQINQGVFLLIHPINPRAVPT
jgi:hypothetical protein